MSSGNDDDQMDWYFDNIEEIDRREQEEKDKNQPGCMWAVLISMIPIGILAVGVWTAGTFGVIIALIIIVILYLMNVKSS